METTILRAMLIALLAIFVIPLHYAQCQWTNYLEDFEDQDSDFELNPCVEWYFYSPNLFDPDIKLFVVKPEYEWTELPLMSKDFTENNGNYRICKETVLNIEGAKTWMYCDIDLYKSSDYSKSVFLSQRFKMDDYRYGIPIWNAFELPINYISLSIKEIRFSFFDWKYVSDELPFDDISITNLEQLYREEPDVCNYHIQFIPNDLYIDEATELQVFFYNGYPTMEVDVYIAIGNSVGLYFFPNWTTEVRYTTITLPQYFGSFDWITIGTYIASELPLQYGDNYAYMLLTRHDNGEILGKISSSLVRLE